MTIATRKSPLMQVARMAVVAFLLLWVLLPFNFLL
jgi:hypothetical protein